MLEGIPWRVSGTPYGRLERREKEGNFNAHLEQRLTRARGGHFQALFQPMDGSME